MANNTTVTCPSPMKATSNGVFQGDNPLDFALPLAILQICLVVALTRILAYFLRPLRQPRVIAEIVVSMYYTCIVFVCLAYSGGSKMVVRLCFHAVNNFMVYFCSDFVRWNFPFSWLSIYWQINQFSWICKWSYQNQSNAFPRLCGSVRFLLDSLILELNIMHFLICFSICIMSLVVA